MPASQSFAGGAKLRGGFNEKLEVASYLTGQHPHKFCELVIEKGDKALKISIDRLTVCGNRLNDLEKFYRQSEVTDYKSFAKYPYRHSVHFLDGSVLQIAEKDAVNSGKIKELRYDFNPNNKLYEKLHLQVLGHMKDLHFTRIDVAFDVYDIDMSSWRWIDTKGRPFNVWYSGTGEVETWYIGGKSSDLKIRIYNKAKEQKLDNKVWWRVEVQIRRETCKLIQAFDGKVMYNPFDDIYAVVDGDYKHLDIKTRAMVKYLINEPQCFSELSVNSRSKYKKILLENCSSDTLNFAEEWKKKYSLLRSELKSWLAFANNRLIEL